VGGTHKKLLVILAFLLVLGIPLVFAITRGLHNYAIIIVVGLLIASIIREDNYWLPVVLLYACLLCADSNIRLLHMVGVKLRWAILGLLVFKELIYWAKTKRIEIHFTGVHLALLGFLLLALISTIYSVDRSLTVQRSISLVLFFVVIFVYYWCKTRDPVSRRNIISFMAKMTPLIYAAEVIYTFARPGAAWEGSRLRGISDNPNGLGQLVMLTLLFLIWCRHNEKSVSTRFYLSFGIAAGAILLLLSGSRASLLAFSFALIFLILRMTPKYFLVTAGTLITVLILSHTFGIVFWFGPSPESGETGIAARLLDPELGGREEAWGKAFELGKRRPIFGHGFGTTTKTFGVLKFKKHQGGYPHNFLLHMFLDIGSVGVGIVVIMHLLLLRVAWRCLSRRVARIEEALPALAACVYLAGVLNAFFENWMFSAGSPSAFPYWLMSMVMVRYFREYRKGAGNLPQPQAAYSRLARF